MPRPPKELKAFARVELEPGQKKTVSMELDQQSLSYWDTANKKWEVESGEHQILLGASSRDIRNRLGFEASE